MRIATTAPTCTSGASSVDAAAHRVVTWDDRRLAYDLALIAIGARAVTAIPGSVTLEGPGYSGRFRQMLRDLEDRRESHVAFAVPPGATWPLPLYELALMTAARVVERELRDVRLTLVTPEQQPLDFFGAAASQAVRELLDERGAPTLALPHPLRRQVSAHSGGDPGRRPSREPAQRARPSARRVAR